jgi:hypothetical protein
MAESKQEEAGVNKNAECVEPPSLRPRHTVGDARTDAQVMHAYSYYHFGPIGLSFTNQPLVASGY